MSSGLREGSGPRCQGSGGHRSRGLTVVLGVVNLAHVRVGEAGRGGSEHRCDLTCRRPRGSVEALLVTVMGGLSGVWGRGEGRAAHLSAPDIRDPPRRAWFQENEALEQKAPKPTGPSPSRVRMAASVKAPRLPTRSLVS